MSFFLHDMELNNVKITILKNSTIKIEDEHGENLLAIKRISRTTPRISGAITEVEVVMFDDNFLSKFKQTSNKPKESGRILTL